MVRLTRTLFILSYYESFQLNIDEIFEETSLVVSFQEAQLCNTIKQVVAGGTYSKYKMCNSFKLIL